MKVVLIDDEYYALLGLKKLLDDFKEVQIVGMFTSSAHALKNIEVLSPDVVFLDIEMPGITGIELFSMILDRLNQVRIVFITAYEQYAVKAFELCAVDYIVKPVEKERLQKTFERFNIADAMQNTDLNPIAINCFSKLSISVNGELIDSCKRKKAEELIAYLVCHKGEFVAKEKIMADLWPESDKDKAANSLYVTYYCIRKLSENGVSFPVESCRGKMRICMEKIDCDICRFEKLASLCKTVDSQTIDAAAEAVELYKGMLFEGDYYTWSEMYQARFDIMYMELLDNVIMYYTHENDLYKVKYFKTKKN